ncbi:MFS transporter [Parvularcula sp. ZS-1/3]|uniref:MFS transporter n=1 Tax=Parvularcula mediterranea TaxID=2732508 RepID=A0A7Y3RLE8_9PROT|nr:MFS transporter [Parvularcula mediterranea]NNU16228.1 MFS transporter [Parvularcula mediterranea]
MSQTSAHTLPAATYGVVTALVFAMFFMFGMTTDAVGEIISIARGELGITNTEAAAFHWATMIAIALSGVTLGFLSDSIGRKRTIVIGLALYGVASALFFAGSSFQLYTVLLFISGFAIGIFKTAGLAVIGDISSSTDDHTKKMNAVEGFFGVGAIAGPALVVYLDHSGASWRWLYIVAAALCAVMIVAMSRATFPPTVQSEKSEAGLGHTLRLMRSPYAFGFSMMIALYVASEVAIFVWLPTFLDGFEASGMTAFFAAYAVMIFFVLRAAGRFLGVFVLNLLDWKIVLVLFTGLIFACFAGSMVGGQVWAVYLLPLSGLFMSMIYPTLNSKAISCYPKVDHGAVAGVTLFFTAAAAALAPLAMAFASDRFGGGDLKVGFGLATGFALLLFAGTLFNLIRDPAGKALREANESEY